MKKIMFSDKFGFTQAVLNGRKTQTRRIIKSSDAFDRVNTDFDWSKKDIKNWNNSFTQTFQNMKKDEQKKCLDYLLSHPKYKLGEIVAIAQSYCDIAGYLEDYRNATCAGHYEKQIEKASWYANAMYHPGFRNKMFVGAERMIHQIRITNVRVERLQDISDNDCLSEGIIKWDAGQSDIPFFTYQNAVKCDYDTPREAYAALIDKISGKGTWDKNPFVFVYDFELLK